MIMGSSRDEFTLLLQNSDNLLVSGLLVGAQSDGHQHGIFIQSSLNLHKFFLQISLAY